MTKIITSASNPLPKRIRALADKKTRQREQAFVVEGMQPVWRAAESGWNVDVLLVTADAMETDVVATMAHQLEQNGTRLAYLSQDLFNRISDRDGPAGLMAIVNAQTSRLRHLTISPDDVWLILHRVHNPGNLGTIIRTADAAGCAGIILCGDSTDPFAPSAVKASMGSVFAVPITIEPEFDRVREWATRYELRLVGTSGSVNDSHWDRSWSTPIGIVLGNEGDGLPQDILDQLESVVRIPMSGTAESLNLSIAAALLMYEAQRKRID